MARSARERQREVCARVGLPGCPTWRNIAPVHGSAPLAWRSLGLLAIAACAVALVAGAAWLLWRRLRLRRAVRRRAPRLRHPLVLAHGLFGFDEIAVAGVRNDYFRGLTDRLARHAHAVHRPRVAAAGSVAARAEELATCIRALPDRRVNVVAHSMGGLDARYAIACLGLSAKVASLTTIGTPHLGTPLADLGTGLGERLGLRTALERLGISVDAFYDLTTPRMTEFNRAVPDARGVAYASVVGAVRRKRRTNPLLLPGHLYLLAHGGDNDGLVPADSQRWGEVLCEIDADHWAQIGWSRHFDAAAFYDGLLGELRGRGF
jgi:triacylglycerol lipase